jgi:hypothetical protein
MVGSKELLQEQIEWELLQDSAQFAESIRIYLNY